jgi:hypothetical protein
MGNRLFDIDVLARLTGPNGHQRVPMIRRRNDNCVNVFAVEQSAEVFDAIHLASRIGQPFLFASGKDFIHVAESNDAHACDFPELVDQLRAADAEPCYRQPNGIVGSTNLRPK